MRAVGYRRVSDQKQVVSGLGLEDQEVKIRAKAQELGAEEVAIYTDAGFSGALPINRLPGLLDAIGSLRRGDVLIVAKRDRLSRGDPLKSAMIERLVTRQGARIVSTAGEGTADDDPSSILMRRIVDAFSEYERLIIKARTRSALDRKRARGELVSGEAPYGSRVGADGVTLEPEPIEQEIIELMREYVGRGLSRRKIVARLKARQVNNRKGRPFSLTSVQRICVRIEAEAA